MGILDRVRRSFGAPLDLRGPKDFHIEMLEAKLKTRDDELEAMYGVIRSKTAEIDDLRCRLAAREMPEIDPGLVPSSRARENFQVGTVFDTEQAREHYRDWLDGQG